MHENIDTMFNENAEQIVTLIRAQNWKNGGVLSVDHPEAVAAVAQAMKVAYAQGVVRGTEDSGDRMLAAFDEHAMKLLSAADQDPV